MEPKPVPHILNGHQSSFEWSVCQGRGRYVGKYKEMEWVIFARGWEEMIKSLVWGGGGGRGGRTGGEEEREEEGGGICNIVESWTGIRYIIQNVMSVGTETLGHQNPCLT